MNTHTEAAERHALQCGWDSMYEAWEYGLAHSPSSDDLAHEAHAQNPERFAASRLDDLANYIYGRLSDSWSTAELIEQLFEEDWS